MPLSLSPPARAGWMATRLGMLALSPHVGEDPGPVRHWEAWTAIGSGSLVYPAVGAADVPRGWRCPTPVSVYTTLQGLAKFADAEQNQPGIKRTTNIFNLGQDQRRFFFEDYLPFSKCSVGLCLCSLGWTLLPPLNFLVESRDGRFVRDPRFSFQILLEYRLSC